jgi:hypothetical protein
MFMRLDPAQSIAEFSLAGHARLCLAKPSIFV